MKYYQAIGLVSSLKTKNTSRTISVLIIRVTLVITLTMGTEMVMIIIDHYPNDGDRDGTGTRRHG
jgi:hypothetical protein